MQPRKEDLHLLAMGGGGDENDCFIRIIAQKQFLDYEVEVISNV